MSADALDERLRYPEPTRAMLFPKAKLVTFIGDYCVPVSEIPECDTQRFH